MAKENLISVIMSAYNEDIAELSNSVYSILNQTYSNIELIIVNDNPCNSDIDQFLKGLNDNRVKVIRNNKNMGLPYSLNKALSYSSGKYIARMDADDESMPSRLEKELTYLLSNNLDIVGSGIALMDYDGNSLGIEKIYTSNINKIRKWIKWSQCIVHPTWLTKREVYKNLKGYRQIFYCEDYDFILRAIYQKYKVGNIPEVCYIYKIRENSITQKNIIEQNVRSIYLSSLKSKINCIEEKEIISYFESEAHKKEINLLKDYYKAKQDFLSGKKFLVRISGLRLFATKYFYYFLVRYIATKCLCKKIYIYNRI